MKIVEAVETRYICDFCGSKHRDEASCLACEARHSCSCTSTYLYGFGEIIVSTNCNVCGNYLGSVSLRLSDLTEGQNQEMLKSIEDFVRATLDKYQLACDG